MDPINITELSWPKYLKGSKSRTFSTPIIRNLDILVFISIPSRLFICLWTKLTDKNKQFNFDNSVKSMALLSSISIVISLHSIFFNRSQTFFKSVQFVIFKGLSIQKAHPQAPYSALFPTKVFKACQCFN